MPPDQPDLTPTMTFSKMQWPRTDDDARMNLGDTSYMNMEAAACGAQCDAVTEIVINDLDATTALEWGEGLLRCSR